MQEQHQLHQHSEVYYDTAELSKLKYVKITYTDIDGEMHEVCTEVKFMGNTLISLFFNQTQNVYINCPQDVILKFVTQDAMYIASATMKEFKRSGSTIYFSVLPPKKMVRQQNRKFSRVDIDRSGVLVVNDDKGRSTTYLSKIVNISASGVLVRDLETMFDDKPECVELSKYDCYHLILFLEPDLVFKLFARYVRHDFINDSHRYAFHYMSVKPEIVTTINKYVTNEQMKQLKVIQTN